MISEHREIEETFLTQYPQHGVHAHEATKKYN